VYPFFVFSYVKLFARKFVEEGMARMNARDRKKYYPILAVRYGENCRICGERGDKFTLFIDHIDGDNSNNDIENLEFLCPKCNSMKDPKGSKKIKILSPAFVDEYMTIHGKTAEMEKNAMAEPFFRRWLFVWLRKNGEINYNELVDSGAESAHCSQDAVKRYIKKVTSPSGWAEMVKDENNTIFVRLKKPWQKRINIESSETKNNSIDSESKTSPITSKVLLMK
jgi:hypothetical protein